MPRVASNSNNISYDFCSIFLQFPKSPLDFFSFFPFFFRRRLLFFLFHFSTVKVRKKISSHLFLLWKYFFIIRNENWRLFLLFPFVGWPTQAIIYFFFFFFFFSKLCEWKIHILMFFFFPQRGFPFPLMMFFGPNEIFSGLSFPFRMWFRAGWLMWFRGSQVQIMIKKKC
jgi:hypothetical protein